MQPYIMPDDDMPDDDINDFAAKLFDSAAMLDALSVDHSTPVRTRFAPSPNGYLHAGHALSAVLNRDFTMKYGGQFLLRIEDIDASRSRPEYIQMIIDDMRWLDIQWDGDIVFQSARIDSYRHAFDQLRAMELIYPCFCSRSDISKAIAKRPVKHGPDGPHYPGTCRDIGQNLAHVDISKPHSWRLDIAKAMAHVSAAHPITWFDCEHGTQIADPAMFGDIVIWRKDAPASYHLAASCDDAADGITHIIRGMDLFEYTAVHRLLQQLLDLPVPQYWHHPLLCDEAGEKLSKSRDSQSLFTLRNAGIAPNKVISSAK